MQSPATVVPREKAGNKINMVKWSLGCAGVSMMLFAGLTLMALIVTPVAFRTLSPENQYRVMKRFPFMASFQPTNPYKFLPTVPVRNVNALALLATPSTPKAAIRVANNISSLSSGGDNTVLTPTALVTDPATVAPSATPSPAASPRPVIAATKVQAAVQLAQASDVGQPTMTLTPIPTDVIAPTTIPTATDIPIPMNFHATGYKVEAQDWNACGPANLTQVLHYFGWRGDQKQAESYLKPNREDRNVSPWQMVSYVNNNTGVKALWRVAGNMTLIKRLVSQKFGVILESGYDVPGQGWMGHYMTVVGYDDNDKVLYWLDTNVSDPTATGVREKQDSIDARWQDFNRLFIVVYLKDRESELAAILGPDADLTYNAQNALGIAQAEASAHPTNPFTWFNMGSSYTMLGQYKEAAAAFDQAQAAGTPLPFRMLWYQFTPYEAYYNVGNYTNVIALAQTATTFDEETFYWRAMAEAAMGKTAQAVEDFKHVLAFNPNYSLASEELAQVQNGNFLPPVIASAR